MNITDAFLNYKEKEINVVKYINDEKTISSVKFKYFFYSTPINKTETQFFIVEETDVVGNTGEKLVKIILKENSRDCLESTRGYLLSEGCKLFESDVDIVDKFLNETDDVKFARRRRIHLIDIETDMCNTPLTPEKPITSITVYDYQTETYYVFVWRADLPEKKKEINGNRVIYYMNNEKTMLLAFKALMRIQKPDIVAGWYSNNFDIPYIYNRMMLLKLNPREIDITNSFRCANSQRGHDIVFYNRANTINFVDLIDVLKKAIHKQPPSYKLSDVSRFFLGEEYAKYEGGSPVDWFTNLERFIEYNIRDVELLVLLEKSIGLINYLLTVQCEIVPMKMHKILFNSFVLDLFLQREVKDIAFPDHKTMMNIEGELYNVNDYKVKIIGGRVIAPKPKLYKNVIILDFAGMYRTIYSTFNFSPDTCIENGNMDLGQEDVQIINLKNKMASVKSISLRFTDEKRGLVPMLIDKLNDSREHYKKIRGNYKKGTMEWVKYNGLQDAIKELANSFFGVMTFTKFRMFNEKVGAAITKAGREMQIFIEKETQKIGYEVIYGDTDSIFIRLNSEWDLETCKKKSFELVEILNKELKRFTREFSGSKKCEQWHCLQLEYQSLFSSFLMADAKKKYIGILDNGEMYVKGMEVVRRDTPVPFKELLTKIILMILNSKDAYKIRLEIIEMKRKLIEETSLWDLRVIKQLSRHLDDYKVIPQHARAAIYSNNKFKTSFSKLDFPGMIYTIGDTDVLSIPDEKFKLPSNLKLNWDKYFDMFVYGKLKLLENIPNVNVAALYSKNKQLMEFDEAKE